jgi:hypothetical protein
MNIVFADTFTKSLRKLRIHNRWYWKLIDLCRYDIPRFCTNVWQFRKELWNNYKFDSNGALRMLKKNLERNANYLEFYGYEIEESRNKKIEKMHRAIEILEHHIEDDFIELAEKELGYELVSRWNFGEPDEKGMVALLDDETEEEKVKNKALFELSRKIEKDTWKELFRILEGQDYDDYSEYIKDMTDEEKKAEDLWYKWFDGSGLKGWWD